MRGRPILTRVLSRLQEGLRRTASRLGGRLEEVFGGDRPGARQAISESETADALEEVLLEADVGVVATRRIIATVRDGVGSSEGPALRDLVKRKIVQILNVPAAPSTNGTSPHVVLVVGVNGTGKTTTVGKLARLLRREGRQPLICAADTFRAAAVDQLEVVGRPRTCGPGQGSTRRRPGGDRVRCPQGGTRERKGRRTG